MILESPPGTAEEILAFDDVTVEAGAYYDTALWNVRFSLPAGGLALVKLEREHLRPPLADAAAGLLPPSEGVVRFSGQDWRGMNPARSDRNRGRIGRVFATGGWVSNLSVTDNILLAQRHHTKRPRREIEAEAMDLARLFGLPGLPQGAVAQARRGDLQRAACVRAVLGSPRLLVLEMPTDHHQDLTPPLINAVTAARRRGAAAVWTTAEPRVWADKGLRPSLKFILSGSQMLLPDSES